MTEDKLTVSERLKAAIKSPAAAIRQLLGLSTIRYIVSSVIAFIIDYVCILVLEGLFSEIPAAMELAAVIAFLISSQVNFHINRLWVFKAKKSLLAEMGGYYALAAVSFCFKTFVALELLVRVLKLPLWIGKPIAEAVMFIVNYFVQKKLIFKKREGKKQDAA